MVLALVPMVLLAGKWWVGCMNKARPKMNAAAWYQGDGRVTVLYDILDVLTSRRRGMIMRSFRSDRVIHG